MDIILLTDIDGLGQQDDVVTVKNGYGRNFLLPRRMAIIANTRNMNMLKERRKQTANKLNKVLDEVRAAVAKLELSTLKINAKTGTSGKIFGSVTNIQLADAINKATGLEVDRRKITILDEVKELGVFKAEVDLHPEVKHTLEFEVVAG